MVNLKICMMNSAFAARLSLKVKHQMLNEIGLWNNINAQYKRPENGRILKFNEEGWVNNEDDVAQL